MSQRTVNVDEAREEARKARGKRWGTRRKTEKEAAVARRERYRVSTEPVTVRLPWPPALNTYYRTAVVAKHAQTYISKSGKAYRRLVVKQWEAVRVTFEGRLAVRIAATYPDARRRDLDGLPKALLDALEHAGAFEDDSQIRLLIVEQEAIEAPGWVDVRVGPKPGREEQGTLFGTDF